MTGSVISSAQHMHKNHQYYLRIHGHSTLARVVPAVSWSGLVAAIHTHSHGNLSGRRRACMKAEDPMLVVWKTFHTRTPQVRTHLIVTYLILCLQQLTVVGTLPRTSSTNCAHTAMLFLQLR